jgi:hypothetical protein
LANGQTCQAFIDPRYRNYTPIETPERTTQTLKALYTTLKEKYVAKGYTGGTNPDLLYYTLIAYTFIYVDSVNNTGGISAYQHNYSTFDLKEYYNQEFVLRTDRNFVCINRGDNETNIPIASFPSFNDFIEFVISVIPPIKSQFVTDVTQNPDALISLAKNYVLKYPIQRESNIWTDMDNSQRAILVDKFKTASNSFFQQSDIVTNSNLEY